MVRYVTAKQDIKEQLRSLVISDKFAAEDLCNVIERQLAMAGLDTANILSQCYDRACSVMAGQQCGVQKILQQRLGRTIPYVHCYIH